MKRRITALVLGVILVFSGCGNEEVIFNDKKVNVVCATFSEYDWTRTIAQKAENINIIYMINNGTDAHSYQPTARDIALITDCDMFVYGGGESEAWIDEVLAYQPCNPDMKVINMMELLEGRTYEEEMVEGMQESRHEGEEEEEETEYDEHIWLSLKNAQVITEEICRVLSDISPSNREFFSENCNRYIDELSKLDSEYEATVSEASKDTILVADRFPFRYLVEDYNLNYYAAFSGCSADAEASFETIVFLSDTIKEKDLNKIIVLEGSDEKLAKAALNTANIENPEIFVLNSMQSINSGEAEKTSYLDIMRENLMVLKEVLNN